MWTEREKQILKQKGFKLNNKGEMVKKLVSDPITSYIKNNGPFRVFSWLTIEKRGKWFDCQSESATGGFDFGYESEEDSFDNLKEALEFFN